MIEPGTIVRVMMLNRERLRGKCYAVVLEPEALTLMAADETFVRLLTGVAYALEIDSVESELAHSDDTHPFKLILQPDVDEAVAIPEHLVPDEVWHALAKWRLTQ